MRLARTARAPSHRQSAGSLSLQCHGPIRSVSRQATRRSPQSLRRTATTSVVRTAGLTVRSRTNAVQYEGTEFLSNLKGTGGAVKVYHPHGLAARAALPDGRSDKHA